MPPSWRLTVSTPAETKSGSKFGDTFDRLNMKAPPCERLWYSTNLGEEEGEGRAVVDIAFGPMAIIKKWRQTGPAGGHPPTDHHGENLGGERGRAHGGRSTGTTNRAASSTGPHEDAAERRPGKRDEGDEKTSSGQPGRHHRKHTNVLTVTSGFLIQNMYVFLV